MYDVIVVGGGHHGLTCAAYLAKAGRRVLVLERERWLGGMAYSQETVPEAPGFVMNPCAVDLLFTNLPPSIVDELKLETFGLRQISPEPWGAYLGPDGQSIGLWRSVDKTVAEIRRFSVKDAEKYRQLCDMWCDFWWVASPYLMDHPTRPRAKTVGELAWRALRRRRSLSPVVRMLMSSPYQLIEELFESEEVKSLLYVYAAGSEAPLREPGSGAVLGMIMLHHGWGIKRPVGGMQNFTDALATCLRSFGGEIRADAPVAEILVEGGAARGVRLESGEELRAKQVVGALDPVTLMTRLVGDAHVSDEVAGEVAQIGINRWGVNNTKVDVALERRPELLCKRPELWGSYMLIGPGREYLDRAIDAAMHGEIAPETPMWALMPTAADREQLPPGSEGDTLYLFCTSVPHELSGGRDWADHRQAFGQQAIDVLDEFAPGTADATLGYYVKSPNELNHMTERGSYVVVDMSFNQMGPYRPSPSLAGYKTPIDGLWHTGAGSHPIGGVHGWNGRTTARTINRKL